MRECSGLRKTLERDELIKHSVSRHRPETCALELFYSGANLAVRMCKFLEVVFADDFFFYGGRRTRQLYWGQTSRWEKRRYRLWRVAPTSVA